MAFDDPFKRGGKMVTIKVREIKSDPGFGGSTPQGTVTVSATIQSDDLGRFGDRRPGFESRE